MTDQNGRSHRLASHPATNPRATAAAMAAKPIFRRAPPEDRWEGASGAEPLSARVFFAIGSVVADFSARRFTI